MYKKIYRLNGDSRIMSEIISGLRNRDLSQKFLYFGKGAINYCEYMHSFLKKENLSTKKDGWNELIKDSNNKTKKIFIGVACGDSSREKIMIENSWGDEDITYIGIDSSEEMLGLSDKNLKGSNFKYYLVRSNIDNPDLLDQINFLSRGFEEKFFLFLGNTFGNIKTTNVVDLMRSYMTKGDKIFIEVSIKMDDLSSDFEIYNHYLKKTNESEDWRKFVLGGFDYVGFPTEKTEIVMETKRNEQIGIFRVIFYLKMLEKVEFKINFEVIISEGEKVKILEIYYYEPKKLIKFMQNHHFNIIGNDLSESLGKFIFEKE